MKNPWIKIGFDAWTLAWEASAVIGLRGMKMAAGGAAAQAELSRMVSEKVEAAAVLQAKALTGGLGYTQEQGARKTLTHYRKKIRANRRRLTKAK